MLYEFIIYPLEMEFSNGSWPEYDAWCKHILNDVEYEWMTNIVIE